MIELLVVVAIIAILAALLSPALRQTRDKAKGIACLNNLKNIGLLLIMYSDDYSGKIPPYYNGFTWWVMHLMPEDDFYRKFNCPSNSAPWYRVKYGLNGTSFYYGFLYRDRASIQTPAERLLVADTFANYFGVWGHIATGSLEGINPVHSNGANCGFIDGHVEYRKVADIPVHAGLGGGIRTPFWGEYGDLNY